MAGRRAALAALAGEACRAPRGARAPLRPPPLALAGARGCAEAASGRGALAEASRPRWLVAAEAAVPAPEQEEAWLAIRPVHLAGAAGEPGERAVSDEAAGAEEGSPDEAAEAALAQRLPAVQVEEALEAARALVRAPRLRRHWPALAARLQELEFGALDAVLLLDCLVQLDIYDPGLLTRVVDRIEGRYFSMELGLQPHAALDLFEHRGSFQSMIDALPVRHKVKMMLMDDFPREDGALRERRPPPPEADGKKQWRTIDPVELEEWERRQFEHGRIKVLRSRIRRVEARVTRMQPGKRLRSALAVSLLHALPCAPLRALAEISQLRAQAGLRLLHGDLQDDFEEAFSRRLLAFDTHELLPYTVALAAAMRDFRGAEAYRAWRVKLLPAIMKLTRASNVELLLGRQQLFHPHLHGVPRQVGARGRGDLPGAGAEAARARAHGAALLLVSVVGARQVQVDTALFDALAGPLRALVRQDLALRAGGAAAPELVPLEVLADVLDACVASGVDDASGADPSSLPTLVAQAAAAQLGEQHSMYELARVAHAAAALCADAEQILHKVWEAAEPKLRSSQPHLRLMLLNAVVRGGSEELLADPRLAAAVDEFLVQRLDFDMDSLGSLGS